VAEEMTWQQAIIRILRSSARPLHYSEITERIIADELRQSLGATPAATVNAQISASIKRNGSKSPFVRVSKGTYTLAPETAAHRGGGQAVAAKRETLDEPEEQYAIVSSFGMFWRREAVDWSRTPRLLGMQQIGATSVDFCQQRGVYLLYDGREVIYVGRASDRPLGTRLYEHTIDRMSARWDRFSWFGLLGVSTSGTLGAMPKDIDPGKLIPALEAILVEALEPRQNRKRGDDLAAAEYVQLEDPDKQKRRIRAAIDEAFDRR